MTYDLTPPPRFLCIGDIDVDILIGVDRLPTRDGKVNGRYLERVAGGMAANVSVALARLGGIVRLLGRVGDDDEAVFALDALDSAGVETTFVARLVGVRTFSCIGLVTSDGEKSLVKVMTEAYRPSAEDLTRPVCEGITHLHLTSVGDAALCRRVVTMAKAQGATTSLDVERADCPEDTALLAETIAGFDIVFCNAEARQVLDARLGAGLAGLVPTLVTTLGEAGACADVIGGAQHVAPGFPANVIDTTGAGDCFAAACLHARLVQGLGWPDALRFASRAASLSTQGFGAQGALPTLPTVQAALAS